VQYSSCISSRRARQCSRRLCLHCGFISRCKLFVDDFEFKMNRITLCVTQTMRTPPLQPASHPAIQPCILLLHCSSMRRTCSFCCDAYRFTFSPSFYAARAIEYSERRRRRRLLLVVHCIMRIGIIRIETFTEVKWFRVSVVPVRIIDTTRSATTREPGILCLF
jgi:hypothetical protein